MASNNSTFPVCPDWEFPEFIELIPLCLCSLSFVLAVGGNILVLLAIYRTRSLKYCSMYFLASLSIADLMVGSIMTSLYVFTIAIELYFYSFPVDFYDVIVTVENFVWVSTLTATTFSLCSVSVDRYIAVMYSLRYREIVTTGRCAASILLIWLFSFGIAATLFICGEDDKKREVFWVVCFVISVALPFLVILYCNIKLAIEARRHVKLIHETSVRSASDNDASSTARTMRARNMKATITAVIVSGVFFALFFPQLAVFVIMLASDDVCFVSNEMQVVWCWVAAVSFFHSAANPWIYCIRSREFRKAIRKQVFC